MNLVNIGMLLAPTVRSNAYLQALLKKGIKPSYILLLDDPEKRLKSGQISAEILKEIKGYINLSQYFNVKVSILELIEKYNLNFEICKTNDVNNSITIEALEAREEKCFIYSGFGGVILGKKILNSSKKFLHIHSGALPNYRGSTTIYYSILNEGKCFASALFLDEKIDTGPIIKIKKYPKPTIGKIIDYIYDPYIRADLLTEVIKDFIKTGKFHYKKLKDENEETYYIIHPVLKHIAIMACGNNDKK